MVVRLMHYRVKDPRVIGGLTGKSDVDLVRALRGQGHPPRLLEEIEVQPGRTRQLSTPPLSGSVKVVERPGGQVELTLAVLADNRVFFRGTPLLIRVCEPFVLTKATARVQGRPQLAVKAVEVLSDCGP